MKRRPAVKSLKHCLLKKEMKFLLSEIGLVDVEEERVAAGSWIQRQQICWLSHECSGPISYTVCPWIVSENNNDSLI
jgi:hypothetical protein